MKVPHPKNLRMLKRFRHLGGGSVSAFSGSLGAALSSMVAALTHEKKGMFDSKPLMDEIGEEAQNLKDQLAHLVSEDTLAFNKVLDANRVPAISDEEKLVFLHQKWQEPC